MMRMPQPGERWILRPQEEYEALPCEFCGINNFSLSSKRRFNKMCSQLYLMFQPISPALFDNSVWVALSVQPLRLV